jgi:hypothetical protein
LQTDTWESRAYRGPEFPGAQDSQEQLAELSLRFRSLWEDSGIRKPGKLFHVLLSTAKQEAFVHRQPTGAFNANENKESSLALSFMRQNDS